MKNGSAKKIPAGSSLTRTDDRKALMDFIERCYQLYEQKMYHAAYRIVQEPGGAEDAVQDAFLKLMKGRVFFEDADSQECKSYIITVIRHSAIDIYNKKKREQHLLNLCMREPGRDEGQSPQTPELRELVSGLKPEYYDVVECLAFKNLSVRETSGRLGITEANVRKRFQRAKKLLKGGL